MKRLAIAAALLAVAGAALAETTVLETTSPRPQVAVQFEWVSELIGAAHDEATFFLQRARVGPLEVRLDTARFVGRSVRILLEFPQESPGLLPSGRATLEWRSTGILGNGRVGQGERAVAFQGELTDGTVTDRLSLEIILDARDVYAPLRIEPRFILETL